MGSKRILFLLIALSLTSIISLAQSGHPKLHPSPDYWDNRARHTLVHIVPLPKNRKLAVVGDTLYMLNVRNRVIWKWSSEGPPLTDIPIIDSKGTIYVIGFDLTWVALDSATGKEKWRNTASGRAVYSQIKLYKGDMYLVVTDMQGYRENLYNKKIKDHLTLCKNNVILWETDIPAGAIIEVRGNRIAAVVKRKGRRLRYTIAIPQEFGRPIRKVNPVAEGQ
jgi:hypothetical protein